MFIQYQYQQTNWLETASSNGFQEAISPSDHPPDKRGKVHRPLLITFGFGVKSTSVKQKKGPSLRDGPFRLIPDR
jgi:hypothetical protein